MLYNGIVIAGYQLSICSLYIGPFTARMHKQLTLSIMAQGYNYYYNLNSLWMDFQFDAEYVFGVTYHNTYSIFFEDCWENYILGQQEFICHVFTL